MTATYDRENWKGVGDETPPVAVERVGDRLRHSAAMAICESLWNSVESKVPESVRGPEWAVGPDGRLGAALVREAVAQTIVKVVKLSKQTIANALHGRLERKRCLPIRLSKGSSATTQSAQWQKETVYNWLVFKIFPPPEDERVVLNELLLFAEDKLARLRVEDRGGSPRVDALALAGGSYRDVAHFVAALIHGLKFEASAWRPRPSYKPFTGPSFLLPPGAAQPESLKGVADDVRDLLENPDGARTVVVEGPPQSGKKTALRFLLRELDDHHLVQEDVCRLPVLAISVDDHTAEELADIVFAFLSQSRPQRLGWDDDPARIDTREKLRRIRRLAARTPACVLLADVENVEEDACIRGFLGDVVGEILLSFIEGHELTRIVLTSVGSPRSVYASQARRHAGKLEVRRLPREVSLNGVVGTPYTADLRPPRDLKVSASAVRLSQAFMSFMELRVLSLSQRERLTRQCRVFLEGGRPNMIVALIHGRVLNANERLVIGLVASSQDGLRISVLHKMVLAISKISPAWSGCLPGKPELEGLLRSLDILVRERMQANDPSLVAFGASERELNYSIEDPWRRLFLERWWGEDAERARVTQWLIAREAAAQARLICVYDPANRARGAFGRNLQMIKALISSVDPAKAVGEGLATEPIPTTGEEAILPPVEADAPIAGRQVRAEVRVPAALLPRYGGGRLQAADGRQRSHGPPGSPAAPLRATDALGGHGRLRHSADHAALRPPRSRVLAAGDPRDAREPQHGVAAGAELRPPRQLLPARRERLRRDAPRRSRSVVHAAPAPATGGGRRRHLPRRQPRRPHRQRA